MAKLCYICNKRMNVWLQNLSVLRLKHSMTTISSLLKRFLRDVQHRRNVDDSSNSICVECFDAFNEYDRINITARRKEQELRILFLTTEFLFVNSNGKERKERTHLHGIHSLVKVPDDELPDEEIQHEKTEDEETQNEEIQEEETQEEGTYNIVIVNEDDSSVSDLEIGNTIKVEYDAVENGELENDSESEPLENQSIFMEDTGAAPNVSKIASSKLVEIVKEIEGMRQRKAKPVNSMSRLPRKYEVKLECDICKDGIYRKAVNLKYHKLKHNKWCHSCDITFGRISKFKSHLKWHERYPEFTCHVCHHKNKDKESFKKHAELHKNAASNSQCVICEKVYKNNRMLKFHMKVHAERIFLCDLCGKKFQREEILKDHRKIHFDSRPEKCKYCPKAFKTLNLLKVHTRIHTQTVRPYACSVCDMKFKLKDHMQRHERRHTEDTKTIKCMLCKSAFEHKFYLKQHMQRKHGVEIPHGSLEPILDPAK
ncbi:zinc finger protein 808-like [Sitodiplosis mosellana]|uniref:zinc finger protein 808-like n=1 Tax=Sitodiplosis mosellana TaxID=263140 RepID=UPI0024446FD7|nr:zinc finger protein 808-like [Sitodiplosis mosellana]